MEGEGESKIDSLAILESLASVIEGAELIAKQRSGASTWTAFVRLEIRAIIE